MSNIDRSNVSLENISLGNFQGREIQATLKAPTEESLENMLSELEDYAQEVELDEIQVLKKGKDPDGGWEAVVVAHNFNPLSWLKEQWEARGGGPEARRQREEAARKKRLEKLRQKTMTAQMRATQETTRASVETSRAKAAETEASAQARIRAATQARRQAGRQRTATAHAQRLETFEHGIRSVGGFAGAQASIVRTAVYTPVGLLEGASQMYDASKTDRPRTLPRLSGKSRKPLTEEIFDATLP